MTKNIEHNNETFSYYVVLHMLLVIHLFIFLYFPDQVIDSFLVGVFSSVLISPLQLETQTNIENNHNEMYRIF